MGGGVSRRYKSGMTPDQYWEQVAWPENEETLTILRFNRDNAFKVFSAFVDIDGDNSGEMSVEEFHSYLGMPVTKFSERVFGILDADGSGSLSFDEFAVGVWNYCTYDVRLVTKLAFDIFDVDHMGKLDIPECDALIRMVYNVDSVDRIQGPPSGKEILEQIDINGDKEVTIDEFSDLMESHMYILAPAFDLQRALRQRLLGVKYWEKETEARKILFAGYDSLEHSSWESIKEILSMKMKERQEKADAEDEDLQSDQERAIERHRERQMRRKRKLQQIKAEESPEEKAEKEAVERLKKAKEDMERGVPFDELQSRLVARKELYDALEFLSTSAQKARVAREGKMTERAINKDAEAKTDELLTTKDGQKRLKYELQVQYGRELLDRWSDGNRFQAALAPLFQPPEEEMVPLATTLAVAVVPQSHLSAAREAARTVILDEYRE